MLLFSGSRKFSLAQFHEQNGETLEAMGVGVSFPSGEVLHHLFSLYRQDGILKDVQTRRGAYISKA